jgi:outer membrane autotransporter protein
MNKMLLLAGVAAGLFAANAQALEFTPYVGAKVKYVDMSNDYNESWEDGSASVNVDDNVWGGSLAAGLSTKINSGAIRAELEYNKNGDAEKKFGLADMGIDADTDVETKFKLKTQSVMLNAYYDIDTGTQFTPFVGGGIGYTRAKASLVFGGENLGSDKDTAFTWQLGAGVAYAVNDNVTVDAGYRYVDCNDFDFGDDISVDTSAHEFYIGARYAF